MGEHVGKMEENTNAEKMRKITIERAEKFLSKEEWKDVNLWGKLYSAACPDSVKLKVWSVPDTDPNNTDRVSYEDMRKQPESAFREAKIGETFGPEWSTHWFKVEVTLPAGWEDKEVHLVWDSTGEALLYDNGQPYQAFNGSTGNDRRDYHLLTKGAKVGTTWHFAVEMVACGMFGNANSEFLAPPNGSKTFTLKKAQLQLFNRAAYKLWLDLTQILEGAKLIHQDDVREWQAVECLRRAINACHTDDPATWADAQAVVDEFLSQKNGDAQHHVMATGHCHIDTAWLWPYSETRRKVARSWATQCTLMDRYEEHRFTASQAAQYEWMLERYPGLFQRISEKVKSGQFIPIGATWVEMDCNIPSGESFARQFLFGQRFFQEHFGITTKVFWLPDTFGYSSQLPQIMKLSECDFFLTQKLSWNNINKFPHNTFYWQGLDGTNVLSHFPPADSYVSEANVKDLVNGTRNFKTKDKSNRSMMLFGYGDGGGGPDANHIERLRVLKDVAGVPRVTVGHPEDYFRAVAADEAKKLGKESGVSTATGIASVAVPHDIPKWVGELYFELHRGTYTTHARTKLGNRKGEFMLQALELTSVIAHLTANVNVSKQQQEISRLWKLLLLNQFHDVLPGTSIGFVYKDTEANHKEIVSFGHSILHELLPFIVPAGAGHAAFNTLSWPRTGIVEVKEPAKAIQGAQVTKNGNALVVVSAPGFGVSAPFATSASIAQEVKLSNLANGVIQLENQHVIAKIDAHGRVLSILHKATDHESIDTSSGLLGNKFVMFDDVPFFWDAWDVEIYHSEKPVKVVGYDKAGTLTVAESGPLRVSLKLELDISQHSKITQHIILDATSEVLTFDTHVDWHESRKFLKVEFPLAVHADRVWYSTQYGCLSRPNHTNTTWDMAKFEVCGHHWADMNEHGFGVALLNNCKYGYSSLDNVLRLSLLRSSKKPDDTADMGEQNFKYGLLPHSGSHADAQLSRRGFEFNVPLYNIAASESAKSLSLFEIACPKSSVILETVKLPEANNPLFSSGKWVVLRLWESAGSRGVVNINTSLKVKKAHRVNILEHVVAGPEVVVEASSFSIRHGPFEVVTVALQVE